MSLITKPTWWNALSVQYGFANDTSTTIDSSALLQTLTNYVTPNFSGLISSSFMATQYVLRDTASDTKKHALLIASANRASELVGKDGADFLSGSSRDDIFYGGGNNDIFITKGGHDLVIGSTVLNNKEKDMVTYGDAASGIVVDHVDLPPPPPPTPYNNYYTASYSSWSAGTALTITGFVTGPAGDIVNVSDLLRGIGYTGSNPIADGVIRIADISSGMKIQLDPDGNGPSSGRQAVVLKGVYSSSFSITDNLEFFAAPPPPPPPVLPDVSDYTFVSVDGYGGTDTLYSVENIIGSKFDDIIHGRENAANLLIGGFGNDSLYGEGGNDTLIGSQGDDLVDAGTGDDLILMGRGFDQVITGSGRDTIKFGSDYLADAAPASALVTDFSAGANGDRIDISELLAAVHYGGADPFADGYISVVDGISGADIVFDRDGSAGAQTGEVIATLQSVAAGSVSITDNFIISKPTYLLASVLGQSNASSLRVFADDSESGITHLDNGLKSQTPFNNVYSVMRDDNGYYYDTAVGGTVVNGDLNSNPAVCWWYPNSNRPGELTLRATAMLNNQLADLRAKGAVTPVMIWGQGESDAYAIGSASTHEARVAMQQKYMNATLAVFKYFQDNVSADLQFYIMQTGLFHVQAAQAAGISQATIDKTVLGLTYVREAQQQLAMMFKNIHLAVNYVDLPMFADMPTSTPGYTSSWATDQWHLSYDSKELVGDRLADFIAQDLGYNHIIDNPGPYPINMLEDLTIHNGAGLVLNGNANDNIITGMTGDDTITGGAGRDYLVSGAGNDNLNGNEGNDILLAGEGDDTLEGGTGTDSLKGGTGADTFIITPDSTGTFDTVEDFNPADGDKIDLRGLFTSPLYGVITDYISLESDGMGNVLVKIDLDGTGPEGAITVALLKNYSGSQDAQALIDAGTLLAPSPQVLLDAYDDHFTLYEDDPVFGNVLADNGAGADTGSGVLAVEPQNFITAMGGTVSLLADGSFSYQGAENFNGADSFTYTLTNGMGQTRTATVHLTIAAVNDNPVASDDTFTVVTGQNLTGNLFAVNGGSADSDIDGDSLSLTPAIVTTTAGGSVTLYADGSFAYTSANGYLGSDSFTYTAFDGQGGSDTATVMLNVQAPAGAIMRTNGADFYFDTSSSNVIFALDGNDIVFANAGNDTVYGGEGADTLLGDRGDDLIYGGNGADMINGGAANDQLYGDAGDDQLYGDAGNDWLYGNNGNDSLTGSKGNDTLSGGRGADTLTGNVGADTFVFSTALTDAVDTVVDFLTGDGDKLVFEDLFEFDNILSNINDYLSTTVSGTSTTILVDRDGTGSAYTAQATALLQGTTGIDIQALYNSGTIQVA